MHNRTLLVSLLTLVLAGCSLAPHYERPASPVPTAWSAGETDATPAEDSSASSSIPASAVGWNDFFSDARLRELLRLALQNNRDLRVAALNVEEVRAAYRIQRTALIPSLDATGDAVRQRTPGSVSPTGVTATGNTYTVGLNMPSYELDFFGRIVSLRDQVLQQYLATQEAQRSAQLSLVANVAYQYLSLLALQERLELARETLGAAQHSYDLSQQSFKAGVASELDLRTAESQAQAVRAEVVGLEQQVAQAEHGLLVLVGVNPLPADLPAPGKLSTQDMIADVPAGLPSDLLQRRPDILQAEHTLQAANANIGVARAAFFPSVSLTAFGGWASRDLDNLFQSATRTWSFAPSITVPIFAAGRNRATLDVAWIRKRIEIANYESAIQNAFREVADALTVRRTIGEQIEAQTARVNAAQRRYDLSQQRFRAGVDAFLPVLLAQQDLFSAQQALIQARLTRLSNLISLYAALGGGWQETAEKKP